MPRFEITAPNGKRYEITAPDGASKDDALKYFQQNHWPKIQQEAKPVQSVAEAEQDSLDKLKGVTDPNNDALRGMELAARGFSDSALEAIGFLPNAVSAGLRAAGADTPEGDYYSDTLKKAWRSLGKTVSEPLNEVAPNMGDMTPTSSTDKAIYGAGRGAADAASIFLPAAGIAKAAKAGTATQGAARTLATQKGAQALAGAVGGSVGQATDNPYLGAAAAVGTGVATGFGPSVKNAIKGGMARKSIMKNAPTTNELEDAATSLYNRARTADGKVSADSYASFLAKAEQRLIDEGADADVHKGLSSVMNALGKRIGNELDIKDLQNVRRIASNAADSPAADERRLGKILLDEIDNYTSSIKADDIVSGSLDGAVSDIKAANKIWAKLKKTETVQEVIDKAENAASGFENGLRSGFRSILNNRAKRRGFTPDELAVMRHIVQGDVKSNTLKKVGKMGFGSGAQSNWLGGSLSSGAGYGVAGPVGAVIPPMIGGIAQNQASAATSKYADLLKAMTASGASLPQAAPTMNRQQMLEQMAAILMGRAKDGAVSQNPVPVR